MKRLIAGLLVASLVGTVHAGNIAPSGTADRERIAAHLQREDVAAELARRGITEGEARARVAAMTDEEAARLTGRIDQLPAGGFVHFFAFIGMAIVAIPVIVVGAVVVGVKAIEAAVNKEKASKGAGSTATAPRSREPAYSPRVPFQQGAVDAAVFPTSTGLFGAVIPAAGR